MHIWTKLLVYIYPTLQYLLWCDVCLIILYIFKSRILFWRTVVVCCHECLTLFLCCIGLLTIGRHLRVGSDKGCLLLVHDGLHRARHADALPMALSQWTQSILQVQLQHVGLQTGACPGVCLWCWTTVVRAEVEHAIRTGSTGSRRTYSGKTRRTVNSLHSLQFYREIWICWIWD